MMTATVVSGQINSLMARLFTMNQKIDKTNYTH